MTHSCQPKLNICFSSNFTCKLPYKIWFLSFMSSSVLFNFLFWQIQHYSCAPCVSFWWCHMVIMGHSLLGCCLVNEGEGRPVSLVFSFSCCFPYSKIRSWKSHLSQPAYVFLSRWFSDDVVDCLFKLFDCYISCFFFTSEVTCPGPTLSKQGKVLNSHL